MEDDKLEICTQSPNQSLLRGASPMTIDVSGQWWVGDAPIDIADFLRSYASDGYEIDEFRLSKCSCGCVAFYLDADDDEGVAKRTCTGCGNEHLICDSADYWDEASPTRLSCVECGSEETNIGIGFSIYPERDGIRWIYVGVRCERCGTLGCFAGWKVGTSDSMHLLNEV